MEAHDESLGLHLELWEVVKIGVNEPMDPSKPTPHEYCQIHLNAQATSVLLSALSGDKYNKVMGLEVAKEI